MRVFVVACTVLLGGVLLARPAEAQTATTQFQVSITVQNSCTVAVNDLTFPTSADLSAAISGTTTGTVTCTGLAPVTVSFDAGTGGASTLALRQMESTTGGTVDYNLYRDAALTEILGDGTAGTVTVALTSTGGPDAFTVYGATAAGQGPLTPDTYTSQITATVTF